MSELLIEPSINGKVHGYAIQAEKFSLDLKISNCGGNPPDEFTISSIKLKSSEQQDFSEDFGKRTFFVGIINPGQSQIIRIANTGQFMYGLVDLSITAEPKDSTKVIQFFQKNPFTKESNKIGSNFWVDFLYIKSSTQYTQEKSNKWVMGLTWATAFFALVQIIPIIKNIWSLLVN